MRNGWTGGQYSIFRAILGICLCAWSVPVIVAQRTAAVDGSGEWFLSTSLLVVVPVVCVLLTVGWHDGIAAALILGLLILQRSSAAGQAPVVIIAAVLLHLLVPGAPYGSLAARGRVDPGN